MDLLPFEATWGEAGDQLASLPQPVQRRLQKLRLQTELAKLESDERTRQTVEQIKELAESPRIVYTLDDKWEIRLP